MSIYKYNGEKLEEDVVFQNNVISNFFYDDVSDTYYTMIRVFKKRTDGKMQYPFVRSQRTTPSVIASEGWLFTINAGLGVSESIPIDGVLIENGVIKNNNPASTFTGAIPLTINSNGDLGYADASATGEQLLAQGYKNVVCGFFPIIEDYENFAYPTDIPGTDTQAWQTAQRQIVGQYGNGDYGFLTCNGRGYDNSSGWSIQQAQAICKKHNFKFAYNLDGGGSTATLIGTKRLNVLYDSGGTVERTIPSFIVFNGTDTFNVPNQ